MTTYAALAALYRGFHLPASSPAFLTCVARFLFAVSQTLMVIGSYTKPTLKFSFPTLFSLHFFISLNGSPVIPFARVRCPQVLPALSYQL